MVRSWHLLAIALSFLAMGCTRAPDTNSQVTFQLPQSSLTAQNRLFKSQSASVGVLSGGTWNTTLNPTDLSDINCYGVLLSGPEPALRAGQCTTLDANKKYDVGMQFGLFPAGSTVSLSVPSGPDRKVILVGFVADGAACTAGMVSLDKNNLSQPHVVGEAVKTLSPGPDEMTVIATLNSSADHKIDDCSGPGFGNSGPPTVTPSPGQYSILAFDNSGSESASSIPLLFSISPVPTSNLTVAWSASGPLSQVAPMAGSITFLANQNTASISISPNPDSLFETSQDFDISLSAGAILIGDLTGRITVNDDDPQPLLFAFNANPTENIGLTSVTVSLSAVSGANVTFAYSTSDSTAQVGSDYAATSGTATIPAGSLTSILNIPIIDDATNEPTQSFLLNISVINGATFSGPQPQIAINDDDPMTVGFGISTINVNEGNSGGVSVNLSSPQAFDVTIPYSVSGTATFPADHNIVSGAVTVATGQTFVAIPHNIVDDSLFEPSETLVVTLGTPSFGVLGAIPTLTYTILDNDSPPTLAVYDAGVVSENSSTANFFVSMSAAAGFDVTVNYTTVDGTANAGVDYQATTSSQTIPSGSQFFSVPVSIIDNASLEASEIFNLNISSAQVSIADGTAVATISDDDSISVAPVYSNASNLNTFMKWSNSGQDKYHQSDSAVNLCDGSETQPVNFCIHGGELKKVSLPVFFTSCANLTMADNLNFFDWVCDDSSIPIVFNSRGFKKGVGIRDLVNAAGNALNPNFVRLFVSATPTLQSSALVWWTNPVQVLPAAPSSPVLLTNSNSIYVATSNMSVSGYNINANNVAVVTRPGVTLNYNGSGSLTCSPTTGESTSATQKCLISSGNQMFIWIEADTNAKFNISTYADTGIQLVNTKWSRIQLSNVTEAATGYRIVASTYNTFLNNTGFSNSTGFGLFATGGTGSSKNFIQSLSTANSAGGPGTGIILDLNSNNNVFVDYKSTNNSSYGLYLQGGASENIFVNGLVFANGSDGINLSSGANGNTFLNTTVMNNVAMGIMVNNSQYNTFVNTVSNTNYAGLKMMTNTIYNKVAELFASGNEFYGVWLNASSGNIFSDDIALGGNLNVACSVSGGASPGLFNSNCSSAGNNGDLLPAPSTGTFYALDSKLSYLGKVTANDVANAEDTVGVGSYSAITTPDDWFKFDNFFRGWGKDGSTFPNLDNRGPCVTGNCRIWDWRVVNGSNIMNRHGNFTPSSACPSSVNGNVSILDDQTTAHTFLKFAVEMIGDDKGNENGLCEANEHCIYSPNVGAYQGEGMLNNCNFNSAGGLNGITMQGFAVQGI